MRATRTSCGADRPAARPSNTASQTNASAGPVSTARSARGSRARTARATAATTQARTLPSPPGPPAVPSTEAAVHRFCPPPASTIARACWSTVSTSAGRSWWRGREVHHRLPGVSGTGRVVVVAIMSLLAVRAVRFIGAAAPIQTQHRGVVVQVAARGVQHGLGELVDQLARVGAPAAAQHGGKIEVFGVAFEHAVGHQHDAVAGLELQPAHPKLAARVQAEG